VATTDPTAVLHRLGGATDAATLRSASSPWQIRVAVSEGRIVGAGPGRYVLPGVAEAERAAAQVNGVVCLLSAAAYWGWKVKHPPMQPTVTVPRGRKLTEARRAGLDVRRLQQPAGSVHRGIVTTRVQTVIDCARLLPFDEALSVADSALRQGRVTRPELLTAAQRSPRAGRARALRVVQAADSRAANPFESCLRAIALSVPGLSVEPQYDVAGIGRADLVDPALCLVLEADSYEFHSDERAFRHDLRRYNEMVRRGWRVLRFCWEDVMHRPDEVRAVLLDMAAPRRRTPRPAQPKNPLAAP
jgi:very-short-patch-repair endonuclease